jgi:folate-binding protein YgfZ
MTSSIAPQYPGGGASSAAARLSHLGVVRFAGPDAAVFLQGQVSNDTRRLTAGAPLLAALSTPQGRVTAVLHLLPHSTGLLAVLPRELIVPVVERLRKYLLRAKVRIEDLSGEFAVLGWYGSQAPGAGALAPPGDAPGYAEHGGIGVARVAAGEAGEAGRYWAIGQGRDFAAFGVDADGEPHRADAQAAWRLADIRAGLPQIYAATRDTFVAQMLNLDLIEGISFTKGCFTGQEIIARTQHLGRIKRRLHRLRLPAGDWMIGQTIRLSDGRAGRLTEVAAVGPEFEALAVLTLQSGAAGAAAGAGAEESAEGGAETSTPVDAIVLPLPYALGAPGMAS